VAVGRDRFSATPFGFSVAILFGGVDEVDSVVKEFSDKPEDFFFSGVRVAIGLSVEGDRAGELPGADAEWGDLEVSFTKSDALHEV